MNVKKGDKFKVKKDHNNFLLTPDIRLHLETSAALSALTSGRRATFLWRQKEKTADVLECLTFMLEHLPEKQLEQVITPETLKPLFRQLFQLSPNSMRLEFPGFLLDSMMESVSKEKGFQPTPDKAERILMLCFEAIEAINGPNCINVYDLAEDKMNTLTNLEANKGPREIQGLLAIWLKCLDVNKVSLKKRKEVTKHFQKRRFSLPILLPQQGDYPTVRTVHDLQQELNLSRDEIEDYDLVETTPLDNTQNVVWTLERNRGTIKGLKDGYVSKKAEALIEERLCYMDEKEEITSELLELYEALVQKKAANKGIADRKVEK